MHARPAPVRLAGGLFTALLLLFTVAAGARAAGVSVKFDLKDGDKVSDTATIVARATTDDENGISKVEFSVDGQLKATDSSVPYSFDWDTLADKEGEHTITATAYDSRDRTATAKVTVIIDNELSKGADYHADAALAALKAGNIEAATRSCKRALKVDPSNLRAARAMAGIYRQQHELTKAIATLEKAAIPDNDTEVRADLVALHIEQADASDGMEAFLKEADAALQIYRKLQAVRVAAVPESGDAVQAAMKRGDNEFAACNWAAAIKAYQLCGAPDVAPVPAANRLVLAYYYAGRTRDAESVLRTLNQTKRADDVSGALAALMALGHHQMDKAKTLLVPGIEAKSLPALIIGSYNDLAMKDRRGAREKADLAAAAAGDLAEVHLLRGYTEAEAIDAHREIIRSLEVNPSVPQTYVLLAIQMMLSREPKDKRYQAADMLLDYAAKLDAANQYVITGRILSSLAQNRPTDAEPLLAKLKTMEPDAADVHVLYAYYYSLLDKQIQVSAELKEAFKIAPERFAYFNMPKPDELIVDIYRYRYSPVLTPASLYPGQS